jgi:hypothetical protein
MSFVWKDTITKYVTKDTESQLNDSRDKVNACRDALHLTQKVWNQSITKQSSLIRALELNEIRVALDDTYNTNYYCAIDYVTANTGVQASHYDSYCAGANSPDNGSNNAQLAGDYGCGACVG